MVATVRTDLVRPSWMNGFARNASESMFPSLWAGKVFHGVPALGPTGVTLRDVSGHSNNGTLTNMVPATDWVTTLLGWALNFGGTNEYVNVLDKPPLRPGTSAWTYSLWFWAADATISSALMSKRDSSSPFNQMALYLGDSTTDIGVGRKVIGLILGVSLPTDTWWYATTADIVDGNWHHVALVRPSSGDAQIYVDGISEPLTLVTDTNTEPQDIDNTAPVRFGSNNDSFFHTGRLNDIRIYNRVLSSQEVQLLYEIPYADLIPADADVGAVIAVGRIMGALAGHGGLAGVGGLAGKGGGIAG